MCIICSCTPAASHLYHVTTITWLKVTSDFYTVNANGSIRNFSYLPSWNDFLFLDTAQPVLPFSCCFWSPSSCYAWSFWSLCFQHSIRTWFSDLFFCLLLKTPTSYITYKPRTPNILSHVYTYSVSSRIMYTATNLSTLTLNKYLKFVILSPTLTTFPANNILIQVTIIKSKMLNQFYKDPNT